MYNRASSHRKSDNYTDEMIRDTIESQNGAQARSCDADLPYQVKYRYWMAQSIIKTEKSLARNIENEFL